MKKPRFPFVLFDLDGTLVDTRLDLVASTNEVRHSFGLAPLSVHEVERLVGHGARVLVERALGADRKHLHEEGIRRFLAHYSIHCLDHTRPYTGLVPLLDSLASVGARFAVITNKPEALSRKILDALDLSRRLIGIVGGDTFPERKPHPRGVEHLVGSAGAAKGEALLVGDSPVDVETASAAGIAMCGVLWGFDPEGLLAQAPSRIARDADELERVICRG